MISSEPARTRSRSDFTSRRAVGLGLAIGLALLHSTPVMADAPRTSDRVREAISTFLWTRAPRPPTAVDLPALTDFDLPGFSASSLEIRLRTRHSGPFLGRVPVTVVLMAGPREVKRGVVTAYVRVEVPVLVATRALRRGERIGVADVRRESRDLASLRGSVLRDEEQIVGRRAARSVREGAVWNSQLVETVPVVSRGETVRLQLLRGGLRIDGVGQAREDGRVGEWIRVLNGASRREVSGRVAEDGVVHVRF